MPLPDTAFGGRILDSAGALELPDVPERLLVAGGGYVGLELGTVYAALGSSVTLVEMTDRLLPIADQELVEPPADRIDDHFEMSLNSDNVVEIIERVAEVEAG